MPVEPGVLFTLNLLRLAPIGRETSTLALSVLIAGQETASFLNSEEPDDE